MLSPKAPHSPFDNHLLAALPREEYACLTPHLKLVQLPAGGVLHEAGGGIRHLYFLKSGMASLLSITEDGQTVAVGMIGDEGVVGLTAVLGAGTAPYRVVAQFSASALRVSADALREEFKRGGRLQNLLLRYMHTLLAQISQSAVCNRFHTTEERLCRWLLISRDRVRSDTLSLTQETISQMLGTPRTGVTMTAGILQSNGLISYSRGEIKIIDRRRLEDAACECYGVVRGEFEHLLAAQASRNFFSV